MTTSLVLRIEVELVTQMGVKAVSHELFLRLNAYSSPSSTGIFNSLFQTTTE